MVADSLPTPENMTVRERGTARNGQHYSTSSGTEMDSIFRNTGLPVTIKSASKTELGPPNLHQMTTSTTAKPTPTISKDLSHTSTTADYSSSSPEVDVSYNFDWVFRTLRRPSYLWYVFSQLAILVVGLFSKIILVCLNKTQVYNRQRLIDAVASRPANVPLVTVSNHYSCFDDPGLWGVLPFQYVCNTFTIRWSLAAHDICFTNFSMSLFFMLGKCIPVVRGRGVYQEAVDLCIQKLSRNEWVHLFPEGKVNVSKEEMRLKWGIGRIIYESPRVPLVLPMWHEGMDDVLPNVEPYIPRINKKVTLNVGEPVDLQDFVEDLKRRCTPEPEARKLITDKIQAVLRDLRIETELLHKRRL